MTENEYIFGAPVKISTPVDVNTFPSRFRLDPVGGLRLLLIAVRDGRITVDQALECFTNDASVKP